jgi:hypothetical protein
MDRIENGLISAHLPNDPLECVVASNRGSGIHGIRDGELTIGFAIRLEIEIVAVSSDKLGVGIQKIEKMIEIAREQDVVVGTKRAVRCFYRLCPASELNTADYRTVADEMLDGEPILADALAIFSHHIGCTGVEDADRACKPPSRQIAEQAAQIGRPIVGRNEQRMAGPCDRHAFVLQIASQLG